MRSAKKLIAGALTVAMVAVTAAGCSGKKESSGDTYTYNTSIVTSAVQSLNIHEWEYNDEYSIMMLTQRGLYDIIYSDTANFEYINEMAAAAPVDVTDKYAGNENYNIPADATKGYAFQIALRENAQWDDGTPINADTYVYSMKQALNPDMQNYRASSYYQGTFALANAYQYFCNGEGQYVDFYDVDTGEYAEAEDGNIYTSVTQPTAFFGDSLENAAAAYEGCFIAEDGTDTLAALKELQGDNDWVAVVGDVKAALDALVDAVNNYFEMDYYDGEELEYCTYYESMEKIDFDKVGIVKDDEYTITLIYERPILEEYMVYYNLTSNWLVKEDLYEANKQDAGGLTKTTYGTSVDTYASYGPYKLVEWQEDKVIKLTKNDKWYGYSEKEFEGQYQTTDIVFNVIDEHSTVMQLFLKGELDDVGLDATDLETYGTSDYIVYSPTSYTYKLSFNASKDALALRSNDGINKLLLTYKDFRKAISLSINRAEFCQQVYPSNSPGFGLLNELYVYDVSTFDTYRSTDYAKDVLCEVYDADKYENLTGYNVDEAKKLFEKAYSDALAAGDIKETDKITLQLNVITASDSITKAINFINDSVQNAVKGTALEGKVTIELLEVEDPYAAMKSGTADIIFSAWGGAENDPYSIMQCYCDEVYYADAEYGFDNTQLVTLTVEGKEYTMSFYDWYEALYTGKWAQAEENVRLEVLAGMEGAILKEYNCVPLRVLREASLLSQKVEYITYDFSGAYMETYGGFRFMSYNYTDAEWADYCAKQNNQLTY
ncbi:MAG: ABC transporter substrate-binding protein [Butyrivibrio sp.]